jgi:hypothetical protein
LDRRAFLFLRGGIGSTLALTVQSVSRGA